MLLHVGAAYQAFSMTVYLMLEEQFTKVGRQSLLALWLAVLRTIPRLLTAQPIHCNMDAT